MFLRLTTVFPESRWLNYYMKNNRGTIKQNFTQIELIKEWSLTTSLLAKVAIVAIKPAIRKHKTQKWGKRILVFNITKKWWVIVKVWTQVPLYRPISLTIPTPLSTLPTSTWAALMALWASSTAVSNPKDLSIT